MMARGRSGKHKSSAKSPRGKVAPLPAVGQPPTEARSTGTPAAEAVLRAAHPGPAWLRPLAMRLGGVFVGLLGAALVVELLLWFVGYQPREPITKRYLADESLQGRVSYHCYQSNPHGEFEPVPDTFQGSWRLMSTMLPPRQLPLDDLRDTPWCVRYDSNSLGLRQGELTPRPAPGVTRCLMMGDSFVFGEGVPYEKTLAVQLGQRLGAGVELVNCGRPGLNTQQELTRLRDLAPALGSHRAVLVWIANDIELSPELAGRQKYIFDLMNFRDQRWRQHVSLQWYAGSSRLLRWAGQKLDMVRITRATIEWYQDSYDPRYNAAELERLAERFHALAQMPDCQVALVLYPLLEGTQGSYPLAAVHRRVQTMAEQAGLPVLDLAPVFRGQSPGTLWVHPTDHHPNGHANRLAAEAMAQWLRTLPGFLPAESAGS